MKDINDKLFNFLVKIKIMKRINNVLRLEQGFEKLGDGNKFAYKYNIYNPFTYPIILIILFIILLVLIITDIIYSIMDFKTIMKNCFSFFKWK